MKALRILLTVLFVLAAGASAPAEEPEYVEGELLVKYRAGVSRSSQMLTNTQFGARGIGEFRPARLHHLGLPRWVSTREALEMFARNPDVEYAEPNYVRRAAATFPNDPDFAELWWLHNTGQVVNGVAGLADADVDAPEAWDLDTGGGSVVVAVIDSGVDYGHEDLSANIWSNPGEAGNCSDSIDNDSNGFTDDCAGWDFVGDDNDPFDDNSHGTFVSGIVGAVGNNSTVGSGLNWSVKVMPLKILNASGLGSVADEIAAIDYAIGKGAKVANASFTGGTFSQAEKDAIEAFGAAGGLFVVAAGNSGQSNDSSPTYPGGYEIPNILSVASTNSSDALSSFSNYGMSVHLAAPGERMFSTFPSDAYGFGSGTSFAAPVVSGIAALLSSYNGAYSHMQLREAILVSVDSLAPLSGKVLAGGRANAFGALGLDLAASPPAPPSHLGATAVSASEVGLSWMDNSTVEGGYRIERRTSAEALFSEVAVAAANSTSYSDTGLAGSTIYVYRMRAFNAFGNSPYSNQDIATTPSSSPPPPPPPPADPGGGGGSGCFIATAAYGDPYHPDVDMLRGFRDRHLLTNKPGRAFVELYYRYSPAAAQYMSGRPALRVAARVALFPVVQAIRHPALAAIVPALVLCLAIIIRRKR